MPTGGVGVILIVLFASSSMCACRAGMPGRSLASGQAADTQDGLRQLILHQPDFTAVASLRRFSGEKLTKDSNEISISYSVSKKGSTYRLDRGVVIGYERPDQPALLFYPRSREYVESPSLGIWFEKVFTPGLAKLDAPNFVFETIGSTELNGHNCLKIQLSNKDESSARVTYYVASDLRNLAIQIEFVDLFGTRIYTLKHVSFDVPDELFRLPANYKESTADPTAEYRLLDYFQLAHLERAEPESFRKALLEKLPPGTPEEQVYRYLEERRLGKDRLSSVHNDGQDGEIVCRIEYDPTLPGPVKKHFAVVFLLDEKKKLQDVRLRSWVTGL